MSGVCRQIPERLDQLFEELLLVLAQMAPLLSRGEILPEILHLRQAHPDRESHRIYPRPMKGARSIGAETSPFLRDATELSSIFSVRAGIFSGSTSTLGSSTKLPLESTIT